MKRLSVKDLKKMYRYEARTHDFFGFEVFLKYQLPLPTEVPARDDFSQRYHDLYTTLTFLKMVMGIPVDTEEDAYRTNHQDTWQLIIQHSILLNIEVTGSPSVDDFEVLMASLQIPQILEVVNFDRYQYALRYAREYVNLAREWHTQGMIQ